MGSFDPLYEVLMSRCSKHQWSGPLQSCPHCTEERERDEKVLREEREQTRLLREANERAERESRERERAREWQAERESSANDRRRWEEERSRQEQRWADEERNRKQREREEREERWREEDREAERYERERMKSCPYCGQRYDGELRKTPKLGYRWTGKLARFAAEGVCPKCYHDNIDDERRWTESEWEEYCNNSLITSNSLMDLEYIYRAIRESGPERLIALVRAKIIEHIIAKINTARAAATSADSIKQFIEHDAQLAHLQKELQPYCSAAEQQGLWRGLDEELAATRERLTHKEAKRQRAAAAAEKRQAAEKEKQAAFERVDHAAASLKRSQVELQSRQSKVATSSLYSILFVGLPAFIGGSCYGAVSSNRSTFDTGLSFAGIASLAGMLLSIAYEHTFGTVHKAQLEVVSAKQELEQAKLGVVQYQSRENERGEVQTRGAEAKASETTRHNLILAAKLLWCGIIIMAIFSIWSVLSRRHSGDPATAERAAKPSVTSAPLRGPQGQIIQRGEEFELLHSLLASIGTSSVAKSPTLGVRSMVDGNLQTAWNSQTGDLTGARIFFTVPSDAQVRSIRLTAGFTSTSNNKDLFLLNNRIKRIEILHNNQSIGEFTLDVEDRGLQTIPVQNAGGKYTVVIKETQPGQRATWREVCISEFEVWGLLPKGHLPSPQDPTFLIGIPDWSAP